MSCIPFIRSTVPSSELQGYHKPNDGTAGYTSLGPNEHDQKVYDTYYVGQDPPRTLAERHERQ